MSKVIAYAATDAELASCIAAAEALEAEAIGLTINAQNTSDFAGCGATQVFAIDGAPCIEACAKQVVELVRSCEADGFIAAAGYAGQTLASMVAGALDWPMESDVTALSGTLGNIKVTRLLYGGAVMREEAVTGPVALTLSAGLFDPAEGRASVEVVPFQADDRYEIESVEIEQHAGSDLANAPRVLGIGMGLRTDEDFELAKQLANALNAEIGGTRGMAEERGWLDGYIGISGMTIQPDLYLSMAVAGQIQHVFGIRGSKVIAAVDINKDAPIFKACDYGIVGDFHEIAPLLIKALA